MIDIKLIRENPEKFKAASRVKKIPADIDKLLEIDHQLSQARKNLQDITTEKNRGKGIGKKLLEAIIREGEKTGIHSIIARIVEGNETSIHLHQSVGFEHIGIMKEVGRKFGRLFPKFIMKNLRLLQRN